MPKSIGPRRPPRHSSWWVSGPMSSRNSDKTDGSGIRDQGSGSKDQGSGSGGTSGQRLQKIIAQAGIASRRAAEQLIADGRVTINGTTVREMGTRADPGRDDIRVDGRRVKSAERLRYILLYKPAGYVTTRS